MESTDYDSSSGEEEIEEEEENMMKRWTVGELEEGVELKINMPGLGKDDVKLNEMRAEMKNGVLKIFIPKVIQEKKKKLVVDIQVE
ncbi:hypothetical protein MKW92_028466 [Papaver armeniacum]|nr:hypothetical protein MKW92_028466 [Papaver armeniacum]